MFVHYLHYVDRWLVIRFSAVNDASSAVFTFLPNESVWAIPGTLDPTED
jgi:hypothetical protein